MNFICYPKCSTCNKALKYLENKNYKFNKIDIKNDTPTYDKLKKIISKSQLPIKRFFNTSGLVYRSLELKDKLDTMSDNDKIKLLASNGMLIKRPILELDDKVLVGFKEKEWNEYL